MELKIDYSDIGIKNEKLDLLIVFIAEDKDILQNGLREIPKELKEQLKNVLKDKKFESLKVFMKTL